MSLTRNTPRLNAHLAIVLCTLLLGGFWLTRVIGLTALPLHNDEGLHLTRAVAVWNGHPFWAISDGKIINHWAITLFYPQNAPDFIGRIATVFIGMIGLAAGIGTLKRMFGSWAGITAALLWIVAPYLFFYERLAFSDAEAGAFIMLTLWATHRLISARRPTPRQDRLNAALVGVFLALAALFKFTAVPFAFVPFILIMTDGGTNLRQKAERLAIIGAVVLLSFAPPILYLILSGRDFFSIAFDWIGGKGDSAGSGHILNNLQRLADQLTHPAFLPSSALMLIGLLGLLTRRASVVLLVALLVPLGVMIVFGSSVLSRHYVVALPLAFSIGGAGLALLAQRLSPKLGVVSAILVVVVCSLPFVRVARTAYDNPAALSLPDAMYTQYISEHSSGYGLRAAMVSLPTLIANADHAPIIASMFPDSCRRANFYAHPHYALQCTDANGQAAIEAALMQYGEVYVLTDDVPNIGIDVSTLDAAASEIAVFPRPRHQDQIVDVTLWHLTRD